MPEHAAGRGGSGRRNHENPKDESSKKTCFRDGIGLSACPLSGLVRRLKVSRRLGEERYAERRAGGQMLKNGRFGAKLLTIVKYLSCFASRACALTAFSGKSK
jgi:hypothetical protein